MAASSTPACVSACGATSQLPRRHSKPVSRKRWILGISLGAVPDCPSQLPRYAREYNICYRLSLALHRSNASQWNSLSFADSGYDVPSWRRKGAPQRTLFAPYEESRPYICPPCGASTAHQPFCSPRTSEIDSLVAHLPVQQGFWQCGIARRHSTVKPVASLAFFQKTKEARSCLVRSPVASRLDHRLSRCRSHFLSSSTASFASRH